MSNNNSPLRALVDLRDRTLQKSRIAFQNRITAVSLGADNVDARTLGLYQRWADAFETLELECNEDIEELSEGIPIIEEMTELYGIGHLLACKLYAMIDPYRAPTISALWRYAGFGVVDGERERARKGETLHYNKRLKTACYLVGRSLLRMGSPYRLVYDEARYYYQSNREWTEGHCHYAALRKMIKVFLSHLWLRWRKLEGLPITLPYAQVYEGHDGFLPPEDFGWRAM